MLISNACGVFGILQISVIEKAAVKLLTNRIHAAGVGDSKLLTEVIVKLIGTVRSAIIVKVECVVIEVFGRKYVVTARTDNAVKYIGVKDKPVICGKPLRTVRTVDKL